MATDSTGGIQHGGDHYKGMGIQPIDYGESNRMTPMDYTVVRYVSRHQATEKKTPGKGWVDVKKAFHFLQMIARHYYGKEVQVVYPEDVVEVSRKEIDLPSGKATVVVTTNKPKRLEDDAKAATGKRTRRGIEVEHLGISFLFVNDRDTLPTVFVDGGMYQVAWENIPKPVKDEFDRINEEAVPVGGMSANEIQQAASDQ